jgi:hypothetical protein
MKLKAIFKAPIILGLFITQLAFSQGTDIRSGIQNRIYFGINICPVQSSVVNTGTTSILSLTSAKKGSFSGSFELGYFFTRNFGLSTGLGYSTYKGLLTLPTYSVSYDTTDSDTPKETYTRFVSGKGIKEVQKISFVTIPVLASFQIPVNNSFGFYIQSGINISIPITKSYTSSGIFSYEGYYSAYNVRISDVPYEGFEKDYNNSSSGNLKIKSFNAELIVAGGASLTVQNNLQFSLGMMYCQLLSDPSDYTNSSTFHLSSLPGQMKSMMGGSSKVSANSVGLKLSIRYFLK